MSTPSMYQVPVHADRALALFSQMFTALATQDISSDTAYASLQGVVARLFDPAATIPTQEQVRELLAHLAFLGEIVDNAQQAAECLIENGEAFEYLIGDSP